LPEYFQDEFDEPRKMVNILEIIESEFEIKNTYLNRKRR